LPIYSALAANKAGGKLVVLWSLCTVWSIWLEIIHILRKNAFCI